MDRSFRGLNNASTPADRAQHIKEWESMYTQTDSGISMRHSCKKKREHTVENDLQSVTKLLTEENNRPQDLTVRAGYSVTKDQPQ